MVKRSSTRSQGQSLKFTMANANPEEIAAYAKEMTRELAGLTHSAGFIKLTVFLTLASLEAHLCYSINIRQENS